MTGSGFGRFAVGRLFGTSGSALTFITLPLLAYHLTGSPAWSSATVTAQGIPYLAFGLVMGVVVDRIDRRRLMVCAEVANAAVLSSVPIASAFGVLTPWHVVVAAGLSRTAFVASDTATMGALPVIAGPARLAAAQSLLFGVAAVIELVVPAGVGAATQWWPVAALPMAAMACSVVSAAVVGSTRAPFSLPPGARARGEPAPVGWWRAGFEGVGWVWRTPAVRVQTVASAGQTLAQGLLIGQLVPWADQVLHVGAATPASTALYAAWAGGGAAGSLLTARWIRRAGERFVATAGALIATAGAGLCALGGDTYLAAIAGVAGWGAGSLLVVLPSIVLRQRLSPDGLRGRVNASARMIAYGVGYPLGGTIGGVMAATAGIRAALAVAATVLAIIAGWSACTRTAGIDLPRPQ